MSAPTLPIATTDRDPSSVADLWSALVAHGAHPNFPHRRYPSPTQIAVLLALDEQDGESYAGEIARMTGRTSGNLLRYTLPALHQIGVVDVSEHRVRTPHGGQPLRMIYLTHEGRRLAAALRREAAPAAVAA